MELKFQIQAKINKPRAEVFDAVYKPSKIRGYFATGGSSGPLVEGREVIWQFADFPGEVPVHVKIVVPNERIVFEWAAAAEPKPGQQPSPNQLPASADYNTRVEMTFETLSPNSTLVRIAESGWHQTQHDLNSSYDNCGGWMNMACCLKAYLEYGINLREGMF
ncbi:MAG TPA: SRPBCC domain-containing protein [Terriglobales bacterium]|nr:SRPBCC domain-containing protein [Terriglobales bacterium]